MRAPTEAQVPFQAEQAAMLKAMRLHLPVDADDSVLLRGLAAAARAVGGLVRERLASDEHHAAKALSIMQLGPDFVQIHRGTDDQVRAELLEDFRL